MDLGNYQLLKKLATGGMAELFLARQKSVAGFQRNVVVKRILPEFSDDPTFVDSFLNEAKLSAQLNHPNVVQIYDLGRVGKSYFIAMEYIKGFDLYTLIRVNKKNHTFLPLSVALTIISDVCSGLDYAHNATDVEGQPLGIVHRDVTPSNVLIPMEGNAKVVDFGIAKATARGDGKTKTGTVKGKVAYLAPEQVLGKAVDKRADVFSCGIVMVETLCNKNPFRGETEFSSLQNIVHGEIPKLSSLRPDFPDELEVIARKALAREPDERYASCHALLLDLEAAAQKLGIAFSHPQVHEYLEREKATFEAELAPGEDDGYLSTIASQPSVEILQQERDLQPEVQAGEARLRTGLRNHGFEQEGGTAFFHRMRRTWVAPVSVVAMLAIFAIAFFAVQSKNEAPAVRPLTAALPEETGIEVLSTPSGADVLVDGQLYSGKTPLRINNLNPARSYQVELRLPGYASEKTQVALEHTGWRTVQLALAAEVAKQAAVIAPHSTGARNEGGKPRKHDVVVVVSAGQGRARFIVQPWASVTIDGERIGDTPLPPQTLRAGPHTVVLSNSELGKSVTKKIDISAGQEVVIRENLLEH